MAAITVLLEKGEKGRSIIQEPRCLTCLKHFPPLLQLALNSLSPCRLAKRKICGLAGTEERTGRGAGCCPKGDRLLKTSGLVVTSWLRIWGLVVPDTDNVSGNSVRTRDCDVLCVNLSNCQYSSRTKRWFGHNWVNLTWSIFFLQKGKKSKCL